MARPPLLLPLIIVLSPRPSQAEEPLVHVAGLSMDSALLDNSRASLGGSGRYRAQWDSGFQLGAEVTALRSEEGRVAGFAVDQTRELEFRGVLRTPLARYAPLAIDLHIDLGTRWVTSSDPSVMETDALLLTSHVGPIVRLPLHRGLVLRTGFVLPLALEVSPTLDVETTGGLMLAGLGLRVGGAVVHADLRGGGLFGYGGDGTKFGLSAQLGVRWAFGDGNALRALDF